MADYNYGLLLEVMLTYHNSFRKTFAQIRSAAPLAQNYTRQQLVSLLQKGLGMSNFISMHHQYEETRLFPLLARKMPAFREGDAHVKQHELMHIKLTAFEKYCKSSLAAIQSSSSSSAAPKSAKSEGLTSWDTKVFDGVHFLKLSDELGAALLPHLESEEASLRADKIKQAGFTHRELAQLTM